MCLRLACNNLLAVFVAGVFTSLLDADNKSLVKSISFWKDFELHYLSLSQQQIYLNLKDILTGLLTPELPLLNYLLLIGKIYLWACRRNKELPSIRGFKSKARLKYETEKYICTKIII